MTYSSIEIIVSDILISFEEVCLLDVGAVVMPVINGRINRGPACNIEYRIKLFVMIFLQYTTPHIVGILNSLGDQLIMIKSS